MAVKQKVDEIIDRLVSLEAHVLSIETKLVNPINEMQSNTLDIVTSMSDSIQTVERLKNDFVEMKNLLQSTSSLQNLEETVDRFELYVNDTTTKINAMVGTLQSKLNKMIGEFAVKTLAATSVAAGAASIVRSK